LSLISSITEVSACKESLAELLDEYCAKQNENVS